MHSLGSVTPTIDIMIEHDLLATWTRDERIGPEETIDNLMQRIDDIRDSWQRETGYLVHLL